MTVFSLHANFIQGGLLLGRSMWHLVMDGIALATALRVLSHNCPRIQDGNTQRQVGSMLPSDIFDKSRLYKRQRSALGLP